MVVITCCHLLEQFFLELIVARRKRPSRSRAHEERAAQEYSRYFEQRSDESARDRPAHLRRSRSTQDKNALGFIVDICLALKYQLFGVVVVELSQHWRGEINAVDLPAPLNGRGMVDLL